ncbi:MAG: hypothetical protein R6W68_14110, partial [Ignavibacteriaceae bacterium]
SRPDARLVLLAARDLHSPVRRDRLPGGRGEALIPAFLGLPMLILGWIAQNEKYLKHAMHGAAVLALLGFGGTVGGLIKFFRMIGGEQFERGSAITVQAIMALLCLIFLIFAVRSFIDTRKMKRDHNET